MYSLTRLPFIFTCSLLGCVSCTLTLVGYSIRQQAQSHYQCMWPSLRRTARRLGPPEQTYWSQLMWVWSRKWELQSLSLLQHSVCNFHSSVIIVLDPSPIKRGQGQSWCCASHREWGCTVIMNEGTCLQLDVSWESRWHQEDFLLCCVLGINKGNIHFDSEGGLKTKQSQKSFFTFNILELYNSEPLIHPDNCIIPSTDHLHSVFLIRCW